MEAFFSTDCTFLSEGRRAEHETPVTDPPALNQRDAHCVISLSFSHTHRQINGAERQGRDRYKEGFSRKEIRGQVNSRSSSRFKASLPLNGP